MLMPVTRVRHYACRSRRSNTIVAGASPTEAVVGANPIAATVDNSSTARFKDVAVVVVTLREGRLHIRNGSRAAVAAREAHLPVLGTRGGLPQP